MPVRGEQIDRLGQLGDNIRAARTSAGFTTRELALRCDVSQPYVSQVENGRCVPSVVTLLRFADALGSDLQTLIDGTDNSPGVSLVRSSERQVFPVADDERATARVLSHGQSQLEALEFTAEPGGWLGGPVSHSGSDFVYVITGRLIVDLADLGTHELGPGDALCHSGRVPHEWRVASDEPVSFVCVVTPGVGDAADSHA